MPKSMGALCLLATAATAAELQPGLLEDPSCFFDNATGSHSYVGGNIFGDKHDVNSTASAEACCTLCKQYAAQGDGCVFWQFSTQGCYDHPAGCCRLKDQTAWAGRGPGDAYTTSGSIQAFPGPTPAPPPPAPVHAAVDWSAAPVRIASTAATVEVDVMPFLGRTPEGGPFDAYRTVSDWYLLISYFYLLATDSLPHRCRPHVSPCLLQALAGLGAEFVRFAPWFPYPCVWRRSCLLTSAFSFFYGLTHHSSSTCFPLTSSRVCHAAGTWWWRSWTRRTARRTSPRRRGTPRCWTVCRPLQYSLLATD